MFPNGTLFTADQTWPLIALMCGWVALSIYLEQKYEWASKISGAIIALIGALLMVNLKIIPMNNPVYDDFVWGFAVPLAIPMLLIQCNLKKIWKDTGRMMGIFIIGAVGTVTGAFAAFFILRGANLNDFIPVLSTMTGSYIGGGVNAVALQTTYMPGSPTIGSMSVADNLLMALYFFVLLAIPGRNFFISKYVHPHIDEVNVGINKDELKAEETRAAAFWGRKEISLKDIAMNFAISAIIVTLANIFSGIISGLIPEDSGVILYMLHNFLGSEYIWITTFSIIFATFFSKQASEVAGSQEIGTYLIYLFFFVIGAPASIGALITDAPLLLVLCGIILIINMLFCFVFGKLFHFTLEEIILASNANIGGPTTAAAMAISQGWTKLIGPSMLTGTFGYAIGTYMGTIVFGVLSVI